LTVPIQIPWDLFLGRSEVWCECLLAGSRRAVLLHRLDTIFGPADEDPQREHAREALDWRLISPTEADWTRYRELVEKQATRAGVRMHAQRVENVARWIGGKPLSVPQYHLWLFVEPQVLETIEKLYDEPDPQQRRGLWRWLLGWTAPRTDTEPTT
jgi:hypothetical protein